MFVHAADCKFYYIMHTSQAYGQCHDDVYAKACKLNQINRYPHQCSPCHQEVADERLQQDKCLYMITHIIPFTEKHIHAKMGIKWA